VLITSAQKVDLWAEFASLLTLRRSHDLSPRSRDALHVSAHVARLKLRHSWRAMASIPAI
jgi:hypothetical protein